jgi:hypothetical protein
MKAKTNRGELGSAGHPRERIGGHKMDFLLREALRREIDGPAQTHRGTGLGRTLPVSRTYRELRVNSRFLKPSIDKFVMDTEAPAVRRFWMNQSLVNQAVNTTSVPWIRFCRSEL